MEALTTTAPGVRFRDFAILSRPAFALAIVLRTLRSSFDQGWRISFVFLGIVAPLRSRPLKNRTCRPQGTFTWGMAALGLIARCRFRSSLRRQPVPQRAYQEKMISIFIFDFTGLR